MGLLIFARSQSRVFGDLPVTDRQLSSSVLACAAMAINSKQLGHGPEASAPGLGTYRCPRSLTSFAKSAQGVIARDHGYCRGIFLPWERQGSDALVFVVVGVRVTSSCRKTMRNGPTHGPSCVLKSTRTKRPADVGVRRRLHLGEQRRVCLSQLACGTPLRESSRCSIGGRKSAVATSMDSVCRPRRCLHTRSPEERASRRLPRSLDRHRSSDPSREVAP